MSFNSEQKTELMNTPIKNACCRRALTEGFLSAKGVLSPEGISLSFPDKTLSSYMSGLFFEIYGKTLSVRKNPAGGRAVCAYFHSPSAEKYLTEQTETGLMRHTVKCQFCKNAFVQGIFLACGRVSDPGKQFSLEFSLGEKAENFRSYFAEEGIALNLSEKAKERILYTKNSGVIEDFFALSGMNQTAFLLMNSKIQNEFRNNANRIANCETNNIKKAVNASVQRLSDIERLDRQNLLSMLPDELEKTARLRLANPHLSLSQLAAMSVPPISKPGLSHRLKKISEIAAELLGTKEK